jgi:putative oxygen-independent coproporphyrinogen III oxidase
VTPRQLGIYIHWPFCAAICPYCDFNVYKARGADTQPLVDAILADLTQWRTQTGPRLVTSIFFGGGTPSLMDPRDVAAMIDACARLWGLEDHVEIALEANPTDAEAAKFVELRQAGIERLSLGIQALDDASLKALGRFHSADEARKAARLARRIFPRFSLDLIYARPDQSLTDWQREMDDALTLHPDHVSPYQLTIESGTAFERAVQRGKMIMPDDDLGADFFALTQDHLEAAGFEAYEVSNHAKGHANRSRHNLVYWTSQDWIGVGPGAHGRIGWDGSRRATKAAIRPHDYVKAMKADGHTLIEDETLTLEAVRDEFWLMGLRLKDGIAINLAPGGGLNPARLTKMKEVGLTWERDGAIGLTPNGRIVGNRVISELLSHEDTLASATRSMQSK